MEGRILQILFHKKLGKGRRCLHNDTFQAKATQVCIGVNSK